MADETGTVTDKTGVSHGSHGWRGARFGVDAPYVPAILGAVGAIAVVIGALLSAVGWLIVVGALFLLQAVVYLHTTLRGKFRVWEKLLEQLGLDGGEQVLDLGCGRGAVLLAAARRLPDGMAHGIDLWRSGDQSGNHEEVTRHNAQAEGVGDRVRLHTADMRDLPFSDGSIDVVVSSLAIHNLRSDAERDAALDEVIRVLRPGGSLMIADIRYVRRYARHLSQAGLTGVQARGLGPEGWFGGPWQATSVVTASKP
ncbi:MAG: class I SAM-dependent methyltransferase [Nocardiopsaceae bacterium]|nr:class I SAM-dependent methyltransferase [Nocardiopsaceae bacterium]